MSGLILLIFFIQTILDPWTFSLLLEGQQEQSKMAQWLSFTKHHGSRFVETLKSKWKPQNVTEPKQPQ